MLKVKRWHITGLIIVSLLLSACGSHVYHYVRRGETLYSISFQYGQDYRDVAYWNGIRAPYTIYPHQKLRVYDLPPGVSPPPLPPITSLPNEETRPPVHKTVPESQQTARRKPPQIVEKRPSSPPVVFQPDGKLTWVWPAKGKLLRTFSTRGNGGKGLDIGNRPGVPVRAASSGYVVYSGDGLVRYGNLIIIKHNENFLSAYAHNRRLLVKEGQHVKAGQVIAEMGNTGTEQVMLHFEIRRNGKPVNPLQYLPKHG